MFDLPNRFVVEVDTEIKQTSTALEAAQRSSLIEQGTEINPALQTLQIARHSNEVDLRGEEARRDVLAGQVRDLTTTLNRLSALAGQYGLLTTAVHEAETNFVNFAMRREQARVSEQLDAKKITNVVISQQPTESQLPLQSRGLLNLLLGLVLAALASAVAAAAVEYLRLTRGGVRYS